MLAETECEAYDVAAEHTEILIQFGYVTMFAGKKRPSSPVGPFPACCLHAS